MNSKLSQTILHSRCQNPFLCLYSCLVYSDPDIEHLPFFANTPLFASNLFSSYYKRILPFDFASRFLLSIQHKVFYFVMSLARFNLYRLSYTYLAQSAFQPRKARGGRWWWWLEITGIVVFFGWFSSVIKGIPDTSTRILYVLLCNMIPSPLHVQVLIKIKFWSITNLIDADCPISLFTFNS
jgi:sphingolipid 8-(E)-desaturase